MAGYQFQKGDFQMTMYDFKNQNDYLTFLEDQFLAYSRDCSFLYYVRNRVNNRLSDYDKKAAAWNNIKGNEGLKRAIEVSLAGNHKITIIGNPANGHEDLKIILGDLLDFYPPCKCVNLKSCNCTNSIIKKFQNRIARLHNPIITNLIEPTIHDFNSKNSELYKDMIKRVNEYEDKSVIMIDQSAKDLLSTAINALLLTTIQYNQIMAVSKTIALLDHCLKIKAFHVSEAIQYQIRRFDF